MESKRVLRSSEAVTIGHPDKVCDYISDSILDACLKQDKYARVACETAIKGRDVYLLGEITTTAKVDYETVAREALEDIGYGEDYLETFYGDSERGFNVHINLTEQSPDISKLVSVDGIGAGDQGIVWGHATKGTSNNLPEPLALAKEIVGYYQRWFDGEVLKPDAKVMVTLSYPSSNDVVGGRLESIILSASHSDLFSLERVRLALKKLIFRVLKDNGYSVQDPNGIDNIPKSGEYEILVNGYSVVLYLNAYGEFSIYGPIADSGLTGRKIIVDTFGGFGHHGGGATSGKDSSKVDRSGQYFARYIARKIVKKFGFDSVDVGLTYLIGSPTPIAYTLEVYGQGISDELRAEAQGYLESEAKKTVAEIIKELNLREPNFAKATFKGGTPVEDQIMCGKLSL